MVAGTHPQEDAVPDIEIDIDREKVRLDGEWLSASDLTERIKAKIAAGDFRVSRLSLALEQLETMITKLREVSFKVPPEVVEAYEKIAGHEEQPVTQVLRRALVHYLATEEAATRLYEANRASVAASLSEHTA